MSAGAIRRGVALQRISIAHGERR